ncbi:hypothetical protein QBC34DRAFT_84849 [Podospora aff. communis PSN243]|uniref:Uncharacterized protein n=1 Tax=Podospora aff. communis PSN243 TaxID=3040156 RepID=A0AAV9GNZ0_9PEZI|nr:hypothetical protein QBC34DRAFT_84849 [Podospora aff. communis PSN243]
MSAVSELFDRSKVGRQSRRSKRKGLGVDETVPSVSHSLLFFQPTLRERGRPDTCGAPQGGGRGAENMRYPGYQAKHQRRKSSRSLIAVASKRGLHQLSYKHVIASIALRPADQASLKERDLGRTQVVFLFPPGPASAVAQSRVDRPVVDIPATCCLSHTKALVCCQGTVGLTKDKPGGNTGPGADRHGAPDSLTRPGASRRL